MPMTAPYVPATSKKEPPTKMKMLMLTRKLHLKSRTLLFQLSYSHMQAIGWKHISVPNSAPIRETSSPKTGMPLAMQ